MKRLAAWTKTHAIKVVNALPPFYWMRGYFFTHICEASGEAVLQQNLQEVLTREYFFQALGDVKGRKLLDVGCGLGDYMAVVCTLGGEVSGIDIDASQIAQSKNLFARAGLKGDFRVGDARSLPFADESFDIVYSADVFEHISLEAKKIAVEEIYRVLKPGGIVVIKTPNLDYLRVSIVLHRLLNLLRFKSPFIHIAHTRNNPDNEHHGLTSYRELDAVFSAQLFLESHIIHTPLRKGPLFVSEKWRFPGRTLFNQHIIVIYRKSIFIPVGVKLVGRYEEAASPTSQWAVGT